MTQPAEVTNVWDWQRFEAALFGLREGVDSLQEYIAEIHNARHDQQEDRQQWTELDETTRRETELDWSSDGHLDGDYTRDVGE
ncbi:hypothetical protein JNW91_00790 [Micromonospora sp. STR1_7]|uniref:Uncharacterized protein n=1 Tax=Micromonospora parastrephiae TaxID=2806101 RepID=A0ABS1XMR5_9ACTN|nr:hypothetical protein [Micromonospora parastrephiae]MBM0230539.1 hypothetical protein [Micromonospora parastrephiae]